MSTGVPEPPLPARLWINHAGREVFHAMSIPRPPQAHVNPLDRPTASPHHAALQRVPEI